MKRVVLIWLVLMAGLNLQAACFEPLQTGFNTDTPPRYRPHQKKPFLWFRAKFFKVKITRFNGKARFVYDNSVHKEIARNNRRLSKEARQKQQHARKSKYRLLNE